MIIVYIKEKKRLCRCSLQAFSAQGNIKTLH